MKVPSYFLVIIIVIFGFLCGSTAYFYNKSRTNTAVSSGKNITTFNGDIAQSSQPDTSSLVDANTKPATPHGRLSYPANVVTIAAGDSLASIAKKMRITGTILAQANNITNVNSIEAGQELAVPKVNKNTDYYRLNFVVNDDQATALNLQLRTVTSSDSFDPVKVAQTSTAPYFSIKKTDTFILAEQDLSKGTAVVTDKMADHTAVIGLIQPKITGKNGFWAVVYIEQQDNPQ